MTTQDSIARKWSDGEAGKGYSMPVQDRLVAGAAKFLPYESHFIEIDGFRMHYLDEGTGPVVLLLHGNPTWCYYYRNLIRDLRDHFRVIAPDFLGCGLSDHPTRAHFRAADRVQHLQQLIEKLALERFSMVMHDWGGPIGTGLAVRNVEKLEKIVYLNTTLTETEALPGIIKLAATPFIGKFLTKTSRQFLRFTTGLGVTKKLPKEIRRGYYYPYRSSARRTAIWDFVQDIPFDSSHPSYAEMLFLGEHLSDLSEVPVQIIWGLRDPCFHREMLNKVAGRFPHAHILEIPDASHLVLEDAPELVGQTVRKFLRHGRLLDQLRDQSAATAAQAVPVGGNSLYRSFFKAVGELATEPAVIESLFLVDSVRYSQITFGELGQRINKYQRGLQELGLEAGDKVLMLVPAGDEFLALSYAVMGRGAIPIFIDPGIGKENLFRCIGDINPDVLIGSPRAQLLRLKRKQLLPNLKFHLTASDWVYTGGPTLSYLKRFSSRPLPPVENGKTVFIAFTSGATGLPKGVVFTSKMVEAQLRVFSEVLGLQAGKKDLPLLPIFSLFQSALGVCSVFPPMDPSRPLSLAPDRVLKLVKDLKVSSSFGSPTLWNKIAEYCIRSGKDLAPLETILMAGAPVPESVLERVQSLLPENGSAYTPYGATEALPVTKVSAQEVLEQEEFAATGGEVGTFVGRALPQVEIRVIKPVSEEISDVTQMEELEAGLIGEIIVQGDNVSPEYFERADATRLAKISDGETFWHRMGDMGYRDEDGGLYFCGRKAHCVADVDRIYYSVPTERIFNSHPKVKRSALVDLGRGIRPGIAIEPYPHCWPESDQQKNVLRNELCEMALENALTKGIKEILFHPSFPVDSRHNAKIYRDRLSVWAQEQLREREDKSAVARSA